MVWKLKVGGDDEEFETVEELFEGFKDTVSYYDGIIEEYAQMDFNYKNAESIIKVAKAKQVKAEKAALFNQKSAKHRKLLIRIYNLIKGVGKYREELEDVKKLALDGVKNEVVLRELRRVEIKLDRLEGTDKHMKWCIKIYDWLKFLDRYEIEPEVVVDEMALAKEALVKRKEDGTN